MSSDLTPSTVTAVGAIAVVPVFDGTARFEANDVLVRPGVDDPWACHFDLLDDDRMLVLEMGGFLVRTADRIALVDAGVGRVRNETFVGGGMLDDLRRHGVEPEDVTDVLFTHLHFDHVGWATQQGRVVFTNATHRVHDADWEHFVSGPNADPRAKAKLEPLADRLAPFGTDGPLLPGIDARPVPGHTPGTTIFVLSSEGERALLLGDVAHAEVELTEDRWEAIFDVDSSRARAVRAALAADLVRTGDRAAPAHFPGLRFGRLIDGLEGRRWVPVGR